MSVVRRFGILFAVLAATIASSATGATARDPQSPSWAGFYAGVNVGYAWGDADASASTTCPSTAPPAWTCSGNVPASLPNGPATDALGSGLFGGSGFTGGLQAGYNWQSGKLVYGGEVDFGSLRLSGSRSGSGLLPYNVVGVTTLSNSIDTDWLLTARARVGWATANALLYVTGGLAASEVTTTLSYLDSFSNPGVMNSSRSSVQVGWTVGGGLELALNRNWSLKGEYLYVDLGSISTGGTIDGTVPIGYAQPLSSSTDVTAHLARLGLNYRF